MGMGIQLHGPIQPGSTFFKDTSVTNRLLHTMQQQKLMLRWAFPFYKHTPPIEKC